jgi:octaprenyl-diphosphate synthase
MEENQNFSKSLQTKLDIYKLVEKEMLEITRSTDKVLEHPDPKFKFINEYYCKRSAKRFSVLLTTILAKAMNNDKRNIFEARPHPEQLIISQSIEMLHNACLMQDDVLDNGLIRRGHPAIHTLVGNKEANYAADYLLYSGYKLCCTLNNIELMKLVYIAYEHMTRGEWVQGFRQSTELDDMMVEYSNKSYFKAASSQSYYCKGIGLYGKEPDRCFLFGKHLGMGIQFIDDVQDYIGTKSLGKARLRDFKHGTPTGPILFAAYFDKELYKLMHKKNLTDEDLTYAYNSAMEYGLETTKRLALIHLKLALKAVDFVNEDSMDALTSLVASVYQRLP